MSVSYVSVRVARGDVDHVIHDYKWLESDRTYFQHPGCHWTVILDSESFVIATRKEETLIYLLNIDDSRTTP